MFSVNEDNKSIFLTRGDIATLVFDADNADGEGHMFNKGDVIRLRIYEKNKHSNVVLQKDILVDADAQTVEIFLTREDTKIGDLINKPVDYWYEVELNPDTLPQTMVGYDENGPKIFRLFPEGGDKE